MYAARRNYRQRNESPFVHDSMALFLVIQGASEPLSVLFHFRVIRLARARARAHIRSADDL